MLSMLSWVQSKATENSTPVSWTLLQCEAQGLEAVPHPIPKVYQKKLPAKKMSCLMSFHFNRESCGLPWGEGRRSGWNGPFILGLCDRPLCSFEIGPEICDIQNPLRATRRMSSRCWGNCTHDLNCLEHQCTSHQSISR